MPDKEQKNAIFYLLLFVTDFIIQIHSFIKSLFHRCQSYAILQQYFTKLETLEMDLLFYLVTEGAAEASRQGKYGPKKIIYNSTR